MRKMVLLAISLAALLNQGCLAEGFVVLMVAQDARNRAALCESCKEDAARADRLAAAVPEWMELSRTSAGPTATADRVGHYSLVISLEGQPVSKCGAAPGYPAAR